jgi:hypothetical protein
MRLTRCFLNLIISSCNPLIPHLFFVYCLFFFFYLIDETLFLFKTPLSLTWWTPSRMPSGQDSLRNSFANRHVDYIFTLPKQTETFQWILFLYFEIYSRALVPASSRSGGHVAKNKKTSAIFFTYWERVLPAQKREKKQKNKQTLDGYV